MENCTPAEETKLNAALDIIDARIGTPAFLDCLKSSFITYQRFDVMAEDLHAMLQVRPTHIRCSSELGTAWGSALVPGTIGTDSDETVVVSTSYLSNTQVTPESVAYTLTHEAVHTLGFNHPGSRQSMGYLWSAPEQAGRCMGYMASYGWQRDQTLFGDTELAPVGGGGGDPYELRCPAGTTVTGATTSTSTHVNRLTLHCSDGTSTAAAGSYSDSTRTTTRHCAPGSSFVSFGSASDSHVRYLYGFCAPNAELEADNPAPPRTFQRLNGGYSGTWASRECPTGRAIVGALGRAGGRIAQIRWLCDDVDGVEVGNPHVGPSRGSRVGASRLGMCSGNGVLHGIYGMASSEIHRLGGECYPTRLSNGVLTLNEDFDAPHGIEPHGYWTGTPFERECTPGTAMVGFKVHSGTRLDGIAPICARPMDWSNGIATSETHELAGSPTGAASDAMCPVGEFVVGLKAWEDWTSEQDSITVHGIELRCRRLAPRPQGCADNVTVKEHFDAAGKMTGCAGSVSWYQRDFLCAPGYSACTAQKWMDERNGKVPQHNYWTADFLRYGGTANSCWASNVAGTGCNEPMRVCKPGGDDDWNGDGVQDNDCNWSNCGWSSSQPNQHFGGCYNDSTAGTLCCRNY